MSLYVTKPAGFVSLFTINFFKTTIMAILKTEKLRNGLVLSGYNTKAAIRQMEREYIRDSLEEYSESFLTN